MGQSPKHASPAGWLAALRIGQQYSCPYCITTAHILILANATLKINTGGVCRNDYYSGGGGFLNQILSNGFRRMDEWRVGPQI